eukprot:jgi/Mesvir1/23539/Mv18240-RA.1
MKTKGGRSMNPTDAFRKAERRKELKKNKKERQKVREVIILSKDPETLEKQIQSLKAQASTDGALDKQRKHKLRQLEDQLTKVLKKKEALEKEKAATGEKDEFSHLMKPSFLTKKEPSQQAAEAPLPAPLPPPPPRPPLPDAGRGLGVEFPPMPPRPPLPTSEQPPGHSAGLPFPPPAGPAYPVPGVVLPLPPPFLQHPAQPLMPPGVEMGGMMVPPPPPPRLTQDASSLAPPGTEGGRSDSDDDRGSGASGSDESDSDSDSLDDESEGEQEGGAGPPPQMPMMGGVPPPPPRPMGGMPGAVPPPPPAPSKPVFVKSAAPTAVKRQLAHKDPNLTCMVPASVRVRREMAAPVRPKKPAMVPPPPTVAMAPPPRVGPSGAGQASVIDSSYEEFMRSMHELGAVE